MHDISVTSSDTRLAVKRIIGLSDREQPMWQLLDYFLNAPYPEEDDIGYPTGLLRTSDRWLHIATGYSLTGNRTAESIIQEFEDKTGISLNYQRYYSDSKRAATCKPEWPAELKRVMEADKKTARSNRRNPVIFATGELLTAYKLRQYREDYMLDLEAASLDPTNPLYRHIKSMHGARVCNMIQSRIAKSSFDVRDHIDCIQDNPKHVDPASTRNIMRSLWSRCEYIFGIKYKGSLNTLRMYGNTFNSLSGLIRELVFFNDFSLDFRCVQLSILTKIWHLPFAKNLLYKALTGGESLWDYLHRVCGVSDKKGALKDLLYAACFGKCVNDGKIGNRRTQGLRNMAIELLGDEAGAKFMNCELIVELLAERKVQMDKVIDAGGCYDVCDNWRDVRVSGEDIDWDVCLDPRGADIQAGARRVLASCAQAFEVKLMAELLDRIAGTKDVLNVSLVHDGCYVVATNHKSFAPDRLLKVKAEVDKVLVDWGVPSVLEINHKGSKL